MKGALNIHIFMLKGKMDLSDYTRDKYFETVYSAVVEAVNI